MELEGKVAVVTGAAVGTGRAIARRLAAEGAEVVVADRDQTDGLRTVRMIGERAGFVQWWARAVPRPSAPPPRA